MITYYFNEVGFRKPVDLSGIYKGSTCFIIAPGPSLLNFNLDDLRYIPIVTMGINNSPVTFFDKTGRVTDLWIGGDKPHCFLPWMLRNPNMMKFAILKHASDEIEIGFRYKDCPNTFFFNSDQRFFNFDNFLEPYKSLVWWRSTFITSLQLCWNLGFKRVVLLGSELEISEEKQYSNPTKLSKDEIDSNKTLYSKIVDQLEKLKYCFKDNGFDVINCSGGQIEERGIFNSMTLNDAIDLVCSDYPDDLDTTALPHSSKIRK